MLVASFDAPNLWTSSWNSGDDKRDNHLLNKSTSLHYRTQSIMYICSHSYNVPASSWWFCSKGQLCHVSIVHRTIMYYIVGVMRNAHRNRKISEWEVCAYILHTFQSMCVNRSIFSICKKEILMSATTCVSVCVCDIIGSELPVHFLKFGARRGSAPVCCV